MLEELEPRVLLSADAAGFIASDFHAQQQAPTELRLDDNLEPAPTQNIVQEESRRLELVFIDANTPDADSLIDFLRADAGDDRQFEIITLDDNRDGIWQITQALENYSDVDTVHIISHGSEGAIELGDTRVDGDSLRVQQDQLRSWSSALADDADILIYGCNLAGSDAGLVLMDDLAELTGADIAASDDLTGHARLGGDWELEVTRGEIESTVIAGQVTLRSFEEVLPSPTPGLEQLWFSTHNDVSSPSGVAGADSFSAGSTLFYEDSGVTLEPGVGSGTAHLAFNLDDHAVGGDAKLEAVHYVTTAITVGTGGNTYDLLPGDVLFVTRDDETWNNIDLSTTATKKYRDIVLFRPDAAGDYSAGMFSTLIEDPLGTDIGAISLVEHTTTVGDETITAGNFLVGHSDDNESVYLWTVHGVGVGTTSITNEKLIEGADLNFGGKQVTGIEVIERDITLGGATLTAGELVLSLDGEQSIGDNSLATDRQDMFVLDVTETTKNAGDGTANATARLLLEGADVGLDNNDESITAISINFDPGPTASITRDDINPTSATLVTFSVDFSEDVSNVDATDFTLQLAGTAGNATVTVSDAGDADDSTYTVTVNSISGDGTLGLAFAGGTDIQDGDGNIVNRVLAVDENYTITNSTPGLAQLWLSTKADVGSPSGISGADSFSAGTALSYADYSLTLEPGTTDGTAQKTLILDTLASSGDAKLEALHFVTTAITVGGGNTYDLQPGDVLFIAADDETWNNSDLTTTATKKNRDIILFRPDTAGDYSAGMFSILLQDPLAGKDIHAITLVERETTVGDETIAAGKMLLGSNTDRDGIFLATLNGVGAGTTSVTSELLIDGHDLGYGGKEVRGLELIERDMTLGGRALTAGELVLTLSADDNDMLGGSLATSQEDLFVLNVTETTKNAGDGIADATGFVLFEGADAGYDAGPENIHAVSINYHPGPQADFIRDDANPTGAASVTYSVDFTEGVINVDANDFDIVTTGTVTTNPVVVVGDAGDADNSTYTVTISGISGLGTLGLDFDAAMDIQGSADGAAVHLTPTTDEFYNIADLTPPEVSITRDDANPSNAASVTFSIDFSEDVFNVDAADFDVALTGTATGNAAPVVGDAGDTDASTYTLKVNGVGGDGTVGLDIDLGNVDIEDGAGNALDTTLLVDEAYTVDTVPPAAPVISAMATDTGAADNVTSDNTLVFSGTAEANATVEVFLDSGGGPVSLGATIANGAGAWIFDYTGTTLADDTYTLTAQATDAVGNTGATSANFDFTVDTTGPAATSTIISTDTGAADFITADNTLIFRGAAEANNIVEVFLDPGGGRVSLGTTTANSAGAWTYDYTGTTLGDGSYTLTAQATDTATGQAGAVSAGLSFEIDTSPLINEPTTGSVIIDNMNPSEGDILTASNDLADGDGLGKITYTWQRNGGFGFEDTGVTGARYTTSQADIGATFRVVASYIDGDGNQESASSASTAAVFNVNAAPTGSLVIDNTLPMQGDTLTVSNTLQDADGLSGPIDYQWQRDGVAIEGATGSSYTATQDDVGSTLSVVASYTDDFGSDESVTSGATAPVGNTNEEPTGDVIIDNMAPMQGDVLTASNTLEDADGLSSTIAYQWQRDGQDITGQNGTIYITTQADVGAVISVVASYIDDQGTLEFVASVTTQPVGDVNDPPTGEVVILGSAAEDQTLSVTQSIEDLDGLGPIAYQWQRDGAEISGATGDSYTLTQTDVGAQISVVAHYTDEAGTPEAVSSEATGPVDNVNDSPSATVIQPGQPPVPGDTLSAPVEIADEDGISGEISYQWLRDGVPLEGANRSVYKITAQDAGAQISVVASYVDDFGTEEQVESATAVGSSEIDTEEPTSGPAITPDEPPATPEEDADDEADGFQGTPDFGFTPPAFDNSGDDAGGGSDNVTEQIAGESTEQFDLGNRAGSGSSGNGDGESVAARQDEQEEGLLTAVARQGEAESQSVMELIEDAAIDEEMDFSAGASQRARVDLNSGDVGEEYQLISSVLNNHTMWDAIDEMNEQIDGTASENLSQQELVVQVVNTSGIGILAGVTVYAMRGGALLASWFSTVPVWSTLDPLPVVSSRNAKPEDAKKKSEESGEAADATDSLFAH